MQQQTMQIIADLKRFINPQKRDFLPYFFKTGKGEYGEGDRFLGVVVPDIRAVAKNYKTVSLSVIEELLASPWHECRFCALVLLIHQYQCKKNTTAQKKNLLHFYLAHTDRINNWDLVDISAPKVVGAFVTEFESSTMDVLQPLVESESLWEQRIAVLATFALIRQGRFEEILYFSELLLHHPHDLMHKAIGWMLREMGKREEALLITFLEKHAHEMPRTMLRYAIEKLTSEERTYFMQLKN